MSKENRETTREPYLLVVEDDDQGWTSTERLCGRYILLLRAATAAEAWEALTSGHPPGGVFIDEVLPDEPGTAMFARFREAFGYRVPAIVVSGSPRHELAVDPRILRTRYVQKPYVGIGRILGALAATVAVREELDLIIEERLAGKTLSDGAREVLAAASWVPRYELVDVLGVAESTIRDRITEINGQFRTANYEDIQTILDPIVVHAAGDAPRRSGTRRRISSASDLTVPRDATPPRKPGRK